MDCDCEDRRRARVYAAFDRMVERHPVWLAVLLTIIVLGMPSAAIMALVMAGYTVCVVGRTAVHGAWTVALVLSVWCLRETARWLLMRFGGYDGGDRWPSG